MRNKCLIKLDASGYSNNTTHWFIWKKKPRYQYGECAESEILERLSFYTEIKNIKNKKNKKYNKS